jgi:uncharacterized protein YyaL (SSP411 family)
MDDNAKCGVEDAHPENRLTHSASPYLLQHADNPVDWYPWCPEAFEKAQRENKPIFLSIGYSACHWCHVMARESFQDPEVAELMNDTFVSIKVDREERPDIDNTYMLACQAMTGTGGWPLTVIMTPEKEPFFAATYIPKKGSFGRAGMLEFIPRVKELWQSQRAELANSASHAVQTLREMGGAERGESLNVEDLENACKALKAQFDFQYGGFGAAPKFPMPHRYMYQLRCWQRFGRRESLSMVEQTLATMARSGMFDQIGYGFHRYATDREWKVPHFEKMLYDQALLTVAYVEAFQATDKQLYAETARNTCNYVLRDLTSPDGAFYSSENAESEGIEGRFYVWTLEQIRQTLDHGETETAARVYGLSEKGNFRSEADESAPGANILHLARPLEETAAELGIETGTLKYRIEIIRAKLMAAREKRVRPSLDDKILTDWNGLMIAALARAGRVLPERAYVDAAERAERFISEKLMDREGNLEHRYRQGEAGIEGNADDYAFFIWGLIELYEAGFKVSCLEKAARLQDVMIRRFWDHEDGGFFFAQDNHDLPFRRKEIHDGALPCANSVSVINLMRLGRITGQADYEKRAEELIAAFAGTVKKNLGAHTMFLCGCDFAAGPAYEVVIAATERDRGESMLRCLNSVFVPGKVIVLREPGGLPPGSRVADFVNEQVPVQGKATAYVCRNRSCNRPVTSAAEMLELLRNKT